MSSQFPLSGLLVVSIEQAVAAPYCTLRLADAGARVIKIERVEGETARHYDKAVNGTSAYFAWLNRGKESCVLDLKTPAGLSALKNMLQKADIFIQNLAPGATKRLGISHDMLREDNPGLICLDIVGYGQDTDYAEMRAYDLLVQAESGLCTVTGTSDTPCKIGVSAADVSAGLNAHSAILQSLIHRSKTGEGGSLEIAMFDCLADWMNVPLLHFEVSGKVTPRVGMGHAAIHPYGPYPCQDGEIVIVVQNPREWAKFCQLALRRPELIDDPRFTDNPTRLAHRDALDEIICSTYSALTRDEVIARLEGAGLAWSRMSSIESLSNHPALRRTICETKGQQFSVAASPLAPNLPTKLIPELGEHTKSVVEEFCHDGRG